MSSRLTNRELIYEIIFGSETKSGKRFDIVLLIVICISVLAVMLDSVSSIQAKYGKALFIIEWIVTILFTIEYVLRIYSARNQTKYVLSFYGIIDLLSILPTYLALFLAGAQYLVVIRILRILRVFRILKLARYLNASQLLVLSLKEARHKIVVFIEVVLTIVVVMGALMYLIEGPDHGFTSIPRGIYWAIVTLTTVGYGDISPDTTLGQFLASFIMILGYAIIAVPTGIISVEMAKVSQQYGLEKAEKKCPDCHESGHDEDADYCKYCGKKLNADN